MSIEEKILALRDTLFQGLSNQFEKIDNLIGYDENSYAKERLKVVNSPKYIANMLAQLDNSTVSSDEKEHCRKQAILNLAMFKEYLKSNETDKNSKQYSFNMTYFSEGISPINYLAKKLNEDGIKAEVAPLESFITFSGELKNNTTLTVKPNDMNAINFYDHLHYVIDEIFVNLGVSHDVTQYQFTRKAGPIYADLFNNNSIIEKNETPYSSKKIKI